ncbi:MAG: two-component system response regulator AtoC [Limisphaerales bacterium]|jgi:two-component system response regulator AtoC
MADISFAGLSILIVEDEVLQRKRLQISLERLDADVTAAPTIEAAREFLKQFSFDFALLDVNLPDGLGTDLLKEKLFGTSTGVIVMTANADIAGAVNAMKLGAVDYLVKPFDTAEMTIVINRTRRTKQTKRIEEHLRDTRNEDGFFFGKALAPLRSHLDKIIAADRRMENDLPPVLIVGETGSGKTRIARWLKENGPRAEQPLVEVNCSALPESLAESELFGHEKGAFTDAKSARLGLFEAANGGALFLDELPSLSLGLQAKILKAIDDNRIRRVGGNKEIPVDVRIIAATNRDLREEVVAGRFREDLFHRLDLYRLVIPPLRARSEDIVRLSETLIEGLCRKHRLALRKISDPGRKRLREHAWPGNVRELAHELERAIVFEDSEQLDFTSLARSNSSSLASGHLDESEWFNERFNFPSEGFSLEDGINRIIKHALEQTNENVSAAARLLGVSRDYVRYRLSEKMIDAE